MPVRVTKSQKDSPLLKTTQALLTLNSCPMFTWAERDLHRMPTPAKSHLPIKEFIASSGILDDENTSSHSSDADVALLRLPAPSLRGTFAKAYVLLAKLVSLVGWDELLKCRSQVFVMEEEYRAHRAADGPSESPLVPNGGTESASGTDETEGPGPLALATDDEASEKAPSVKEAEEEDQPEAVPSIPTIAVNGQTEDGQQIDEDESSAAEIPTIKVSTESDGEREREELKRFEESEAGRKAREVVGKPNQARQASEEEDREAGSNAAADAASASSEGKSSSPTIQNKRLCERWLDNLFMVLYEVSRRFPLTRNTCEADPSCFGDRTCESLPSGGQKSRTSRRSTCRTARRAPSGRSSASSRSDCTTARKPRTRSSARSTKSSRPRRGSSCSRFTSTKGTCSGV